MVRRSRPLPLHTVSLAPPLRGTRRDRLPRRRLESLVRFASASTLALSLLGASVAAAQAAQKAQPAQAAAPSGTSAASPAIVPPGVVRQVPAAYPPASERDAANHEGTTLLTVTIDEDGAVKEAEVAESAGAAFDQAALTAVKQWSFTPAYQNGKAITARIQIPFRFVHAVEQAAPTAPSSSTTEAPHPLEPTPGVLPAPTRAEQNIATGPDAAENDDGVLSTTVHGQKVKADRASSDFVLERDVLTLAPKQSAADLLASAPGVYISRPEGDAVGHEIYLRGFDAEHGQDIELTVGPVPINQPSHLHGQGYSDLNFIIPETVRSLRVTEGVYDPRQGDFAVAGSAHFDLGVAERGYHVKSSFGSFGQFRQLMLWAPEDAPEETFGAFAFSRSDGFGVNRGSQTASAMGQYVFEGPADFRGLLHVAAYGARGNSAGVLRRDDVDSGYVDFYGAYPDPTANSQSTLSSRFQMAVELDRTKSDGSRTHAAAWAMLANFRSRFNFTGYLERSQFNPSWMGRGDLIEQSNKDLGFGASFSHRSARYQPWSWLKAQVETGLTARTDSIDQVQNLLQAPQNETWDQRVGANVQASDLGAYADLELGLGRFVKLRGGARADVLYYDVDDRLGNFIPSFQRESHIIGYRRTAMGIASGPRATVEVSPLDGLQLLGSYGEGYRSPQALQLEEGENAPFTKVRAAEVGFRLRPTLDDSLTLTGAAYETRLSDDLAFDPGEGRLERIGPTRRRGVAAHVLARPWDWLLASLSATWVQATLQAPPTATAENPTPAFEQGQRLPYVPPLVVRADVGFTREFEVRDQRFGFQLGGGSTLLSRRPLPYGRYADPVFLIEARTSVRWRALELSLEVFNLLDSKFAASEYAFVSDWGNRDAPSLVPARHFAAGAPRTFLTSFGVHF